MSDSAQLIKIIADILQPDDSNLRKQSEEILNTLKNEKPNELISAYLDILKGTSFSIKVPTPTKPEISQLLNSDLLFPTSHQPTTLTSGTLFNPRCKMQSK